MAETNPTANNRMVLLLIGGIPLTMILAATWLWYFVARGDLDLVGMVGTANRGTLVQPPRQLDDQTLRDESGSSIKFADLEPRWAMVVPAAGDRCDEACENTLYVTRQIHVAMGKEFNRMRRLYISTDSVASTQLAERELSDKRPAPPAGEFARYLEIEHGGLQAFTLPAVGYAALFPEHAADSSSWYLVDPAGWVMMSYNKEVPYKDVITDLKFLLKNSGG
jgi:hypothetical protein